MTVTALAITSTGRFSLRGPLGTGLLGSPSALLLAGNFPFGVGLNASALFIGLRETSLGLRDDLAVRETPVLVLVMLHAWQYGTRRASCVGKVNHYKQPLEIKLRHYQPLAFRPVSRQRSHRRRPRCFDR